MDHGVLLAVLCVHLVLHVPACRGTCPPGSIVERGVAPDVQQQIVNLHNEYRRQNAMGRVSGQPKAANMLQMTWDEGIAEQAQILAETCEFRHVKVKDPRFTVGQNLYTTYNSEDKPGANWTKAMHSWYDEYRDYQFGTGEYDHYTQVVWATSDKVGCGYVKYRVNNGVNRLYVCHYGPGGNIVGKAPYQVGNGCENLCLPADDNEYKWPDLKPKPRPPIQVPRPPKWLPRPPVKHPRPQWPEKYQPNLMPVTPKPKPYSQYSKPRPPKRMPYRPRPQYRPPIPRKPKTQPGYKVTREDAVLAWLMYLLIQAQAQLEAKKAQAEQQEADNYEDEYDDEPEYEDETVSQEADDDYNEENLPDGYGKYRRVAYSARKDNKRIQRHPTRQPSKKYVIHFKNIPHKYVNYRIVTDGAGP